MEILWAVCGGGRYFVAETDENMGNFEANWRLCPSLIIKRGAGGCDRVDEVVGRNNLIDIGSLRAGSVEERVFHLPVRSV